MMKIKFIILCFLFNYSFGQDYNSFFLKGNDPSNVEGTNIVPPTPESYYRTQYGNADINEFKGFPSVSIPLHTVVNGSLKESIALKYSKPGVRVNDLPNTVGMNWILETGGIITRTIYDLADEFPSQERILLNDSEFANINSSNGATTLGIYARDMSDVFDNEIDIFNYSIPGYNGSFYLNKNLKPELFTQNHDLKIDVVGDFKTTYTFIITTNNGTKYTFGGSDAIEKTWVRLDGSHSGITSFYLREIEDISKNKINYFYNNVSQKIIGMGEQRVEGLSTVVKEYYPQTGENHVPNSAPGITNQTTYNNLRVVNAKSLSKITTENEEINFNYITESGVSSYRKLGNIIISKHGVGIKKIQFDFKDNESSTPNTGKARFFLYSIKEFALKNNNENFVQEYKFDYDDPWSIPERLSKTVDYLGYFNGTFNSLTFMPNLNLFGESYVQFEQNGSYADRRPNFNYAKKGTLTSITYPTKGTTFFEYEGAIDQKGMTSKVLTGEVRNAYDFIGENVVFVDGNKIIDNLLEINLHIRRFNIIGIVGGPLEAHLKIFDKNSNEMLSDTKIVAPRPSQEDVDAGEFSKEINYNFNTEQNRLYKIVLSLEQKSGLFYTADYEINYHDAFIRENGPGVRLKKTYDVDENNSIINVKKIYYSQFKNINNFNIIKWAYKPNFISYNYDQVLAQTGPTDNCGFCSNTKFQTLFHSEMQSSRLNASELNDDEEEFFYDINDPIFPNVTISYGGDNFEKGGEEKIFDTKAYIQENSYLLNNPYTNGMESTGNGQNGEFLNKLISTARNNLYRHFPLSNNYGRLISQRVFNNKNGILFLKKNIKSSYNSVMVNRVYSITGKKLYPFVIAPAYIDPDTTLINMYAGANAYPIYSSFLYETKTTEYLEDVPINTIDDSTYKKLTTNTIYFYNNPAHYQLTGQKTTFPDGVYQTTDYSYAYEKGKQKLIDANMVGIPLETVTKKGSKIISKTYTDYPDTIPDTQTGDLLLPKSVSSFDISSGNPSTEVTYNQYDSKGNLLQYTTKSGVPTAIVWGYNQTQPIAKVEGATYSQVSGLAGTIINASDADASDPTMEGALITALDGFRTALPGYQVTTYSYDPLIGVTSITPPNGLREVYVYDTANRLKEVRDVNGNLLKSNEYHYRP